MLGLMQDRPMLISSLIEYAAKYHGQQQIITRQHNNTYHTTTYSTIHTRAQQLANALHHDYTIKQGDVIGTMAFNCYRHMEVYFAVSGSGAVLHTINPRLHIEQIECMIHQAGNTLIMVDIPCLPIALQLLRRGNVQCQKYIVMCDAASMTDEMQQYNMHCYESVISGNNADYIWPIFSETTASSLCYTSGTSGNAKGVLYSHRSAVLHSYRVSMRDHMGIWSGDTILCIAPLFHGNAWGIPYAACMTGARLVFPGRVLNGPTVYDLLTSQRITLTFGVPTIWQMLFAHMDAHGYTKLPDLNRIVVGGSACPTDMIQRFQQMGVQVMQLWGMTEMSPLGTIGTLLPQHTGLSDDDKVIIMAKQGRVSFGVDVELMDYNGQMCPHDGVTPGSIVVRGPCVTSAYFRLGSNNASVLSGEECSVLDDNGYMPTGDIGTIDADGYLTVLDRSKDLIKSGGEWISSVELENVALSYAGVQQCAVISAYHSKWLERPLMLVVCKHGAVVDTKALLQYVKTRVSSFCVPDAVEVVDALPLTATGKVQKHELRKAYSTYRFSNDIMSVAA